MVAPIKFGIVGFSEENGHPYSFSASVNGYDKELMKHLWLPIYEYLNKRVSNEIGMLDARVTHVWSEDLDKSIELAKTTYIENVVHSIDDMVLAVDAVIIARDDWESHCRLAKPFLEAGKYVFIDKPLSLNIDELKYFKDYLQAGKMMSCSGFRYAIELDSLKKRKFDHSPLFVEGVVINQWDKYGIHLLEAISSVTDLQIESVFAVNSKTPLFVLKNKNNEIITIVTLGKVAKTFDINFYLQDERISISLLDNFSAFRRTLIDFICLIKTGKCQIEPESTLKLMQILIAGRVSVNESREVFLNEIPL